jgi:hypothetical protein
MTELDIPSANDFRRLEDKVDKLTDAVMRLVLVEERQSNMTERISVAEQKISTNEASITKVDTKVERWINRGIGAWAVAAVLFALVQFGANIFKQ